MDFCDTEQYEPREYGFLEKTFSITIYVSDINC